MVQGHVRHTLNEYRITQGADQVKGHFAEGGLPIF